MINARSLRWILATAALLATATPGQARPPAAAAKTGSFDFYLLSLSIAPTFCATSPDHQTMQECQQLTEAAFEQTPLYCAWTLAEPGWRQRQPAAARLRRAAAWHAARWAAGRS